MIQIQARDREILRVIYEQQFLRPRELMRGPFKGVHRTEVYRRIRELESAGYISRKQYVPGGYTFIRLTDPGLEVARSESRWDFHYNRRLNLDWAQHDALVTQIRFRLEALLGGDWMPRAVLLRDYTGEKGSSAAIGDGAMVFASGKRIVVEVEELARRRDVYIRVLQAWAHPAKATVVLFVADGIIYRKLQKLLPHAPPQQPFALTTPEELFRDPPAPPWSIRGPLPIYERGRF
ncbi:MAG: hypothetical protein IT285_11035 [Bdellovibrionales bacterium]|nr:hypothetical protein [Bdellovibrionales bacterium]